MTNQVLVPARNAPTTITIVHVGGTSYSVAHDNSAPQHLSWDEMLGQVACLMAPAFINNDRQEKDPLILTLVNQGISGWRLMVNGSPDTKAMPFHALLARLIGLTFPLREPGTPLFRGDCRQSAPAEPIDSGTGD